MLKLPELQDHNKVPLDHKPTLINHHSHHYLNQVFMRQANQLTLAMRNDLYNLNPYIQVLELIKFQGILEFIEL